MSDQRVDASFEPDRDAAGERAMRAESDHAAATVGMEDLASDPVVRWLLIALLGVIAFFLVAGISALAFGLFGPPRAPRTLLERDLGTYGALVKEGKADARTTASYAGALIDSGQLSEARNVLAEALATAGSDTSYLLLQQARLEFAAKDYAKSAETAGTARETADAELKARLAELAGKGIKPKIETERPRSWLLAAHLEGDAFAEAGDDAEAIAAYDRYLTVSPVDSDILVARGLLKASSGDKAGAESDFRQALKFIPDYEPALEALEGIGVSAR